MTDKDRRLNDWSTPADWERLWKIHRAGKSLQHLQNGVYVLMTTEQWIYRTFMLAEDDKYKLDELMRAGYAARDAVDKAAGKKTIPVLWDYPRGRH